MMYVWNGNSKLKVCYRLKGEDWRVKMDNWGVWSFNKYIKMVYKLKKI
jgi:hypothetical protein